jgi:hypothetical protein
LFNDGNIIKIQPIPCSAKVQFLSIYIKIVAIWKWRRLSSHVFEAMSKANYHVQAMAKGPIKPSRVAKHGLVVMIGLQVKTKGKKGITNHSKHFNLETFI